MTGDAGKSRLWTTPRQALLWIYRRRTLFVGIVLLLGTFWFRVCAPTLTNDDYLHLSMAQQVLLGDLPVRDFIDPGRFLEYSASAAVQAVFGKNLLSEVVLDSLAIAAGHLFAFLLATRLSGSTSIGLLVTVAALAFHPRLYNYPKVFLLPLALLVLWSYLDDRRRRDLVGLGLLAGLAFLFRHDYAAYVGLTVAITLAVAFWRTGFGVVGRRVGAVAGVALVTISPFLIYVQIQGGLLSYFRTTVETAMAEARRTTSGWPALQLRWVGTIPEPEPPPAPRINVRWSPGVSEAARRRAAARYELDRGRHVDGRTWQYDLADTSRKNVKALVQDEAVEDTHGIDRHAYTVVAQGDYPNATAWLFYVFRVLPLVAAVWVLVRWKRGWELDLRAFSSVVMCVLASTYLMRAVSGVGLGDIAVLVAVLTAWLVAEVGRGVRDAEGASRALACSVAMIGVVPLLVTVMAMGYLEGPYEYRRLQGRLESESEPGFLHLRAAARETVKSVDELAGRPPFPSDLATYLRECTGPDDRVLAAWYAPEIFYQSERGFAGGRVYFLRSLGSSPELQRFSIAKLQSESVPVVLERMGYWSDFEGAFPFVAEYLEKRYRPVAERRLDGMQLRIWTDVGRAPKGEHPGTDLPCFR